MRETEKEDAHASWAAKMTDVKSVPSMEVPEGKLMKKVRLLFHFYLFKQYE